MFSIEIYNIDHMPEFKKIIQCHLKVSWRERAGEGMAAWIPLVNPTYQVISVLLHWFTAVITQDMRRVDTGTETTQRLLFLRLTEVNRSKMHYYCYNNKTTLTGTMTKRGTTFTIYWIAYAAGWIILTGNIHKRQKNQKTVMQQAQKRKRVCRYLNEFLQEQFLKFCTNMDIWKPVYTLVQCEKTQQLSLVRVQPCHPDKSILSEKNSLFSVIFWLDKPKNQGLRK